MDSDDPSKSGVAPPATVENQKNIENVIKPSEF